MGIKQVYIMLGVYYSKEIGRGFPRTKSAPRTGKRRGQARTSEDKTQINAEVKGKRHYSPQRRKERWEKLKFRWKGERRVSCFLIRVSKDKWLITNDECPSLSRGLQYCTVCFLTSVSDYTSTKIVWHAVKNRLSLSRLYLLLKCKLEVS